VQYPRVASGASTAALARKHAINLKLRAEEKPTKSTARVTAPRAPSILDRKKAINEKLRKEDSWRK